MSRPVIGITQSSHIYHPWTTRDIIAHEAYYFAIRQAGGIPTPISYRADIMGFQSDLSRFDGFLFSGGGDINPNIYTDGNRGNSQDIDDYRDMVELSLFKVVLEKEIPFLGICRGLQLVNVAMGGSLFQDLSQEHPSGNEHDWHPSRSYLAHGITLEPNSRLEGIGYLSETLVNSLHHQGIQSIGNGLKPLAYAGDDLIEALELTGHRFGLAVQWHPEWMIDQQPSRSLFESFIKACG